MSESKNAGRLKPKTVFNEIVEESLNVSQKVGAMIEGVETNNKVTEGLVVAGAGIAKCATIIAGFSTAALAAGGVAIGNGVVDLKRYVQKEFGCGSKDENGKYPEIHVPTKGC